MHMPGRQSDIFRRHMLSRGVRNADARIGQGRRRPPIPRRGNASIVQQATRGSWASSRSRQAARNPRNPRNPRNHARNSAVPLSSTRPDHSTPPKRAASTPIPSLALINVTSHRCNHASPAHSHIAAEHPSPFNHAVHTPLRPSQTTCVTTLPHTSSHQLVASEQSIVPTGSTNSSSTSTRETTARALTNTSGTITEAFHPPLSGHSSS
jgi:hypothetical protein